MKRIESEQETLAFIERLKEAGVDPAQIRVYEWVDVMTDGNFEVKAYRSRFGVEVVKNV